MKAYPNPARCNASVSFGDYLDVNLLRIFDTILCLTKTQWSLAATKLLQRYKKIKEIRGFSKKNLQITRIVCVFQGKKGILGASMPVRQFIFPET